MADNVGYTPGTGALVASDEVSFSGDTSLVQLVRPVLTTGSEGSKTVVALGGDATFGLDVDVTRLPALAAGTAQIGTVNISDGTNALSIDTAFGDGESGTLNHLDVAARLMAVNAAGTFDMVRATVTANRNAQYTSAQTGTALWTPATGKAVVLVSLQIQSYGVTSGTATVWFGASGDTTFTRGTDPAVFDGEFAPSNTNKPGVFITFPTPLRGTADHVLRVTTTNAQSITFSVWGYEI